MLQIGIRAFGSTPDPYGPKTSENLVNLLLQRLICVEFGENCKIKLKSPNSKKIQVKFALKMVEEMINCIDLQVAELKLARRLNFMFS
jgi:hypothetical protein